MSKRYQKEIEEILKQVDDVGGRGRRPRARGGLLRLVWLYVRQSLSGKMWSLSAGRVILIAVSVLLSALVIKSFMPDLVGPLALAGILLFIIGYGIVATRPKKFEKRWRGQPLDGTSETWWDRFRRRLR